MHHPGHWYGPCNVGPGNGAPSLSIIKWAKEKKERFDKILTLYRLNEQTSSQQTNKRVHLNKESTATVNLMNNDKDYGEWGLPCHEIVDPELWKVSTCTAVDLFTINNLDVAKVGHCVRGRWAQIHSEIAMKSDDRNKTTYAKWYLSKR